jgi:hypothetical protein
MLLVKPRKHQKELKPTPSPPPGRKQTKRVETREEHGTGSATKRKRSNQKELKLTRRASRWSLEATKKS